VDEQCLNNITCAVLKKAYTAAGGGDQPAAAANNGSATQRPALR